MKATNNVQNSNNHLDGGKPSCPCKKLPMVLSSFTAAEYGDVHSLMRRINNNNGTPTTTSIHEKRDSAGNTPLHLAAQHGHVPATAALLAAGVNPNGYTPNKNGDETTKHMRTATPLHRASFSGAVATMHLLLQLPECNILVGDSSFGDEQSPLHKAVSGGRPLAVQLLLDSHGQRQSLTQALLAVDRHGRTPLQEAERIVNQCVGQSKTAKDAWALERARVARWNAIAGGEPDWETCCRLLQAAQASIRATACIPCNATSSFSLSLTSSPRDGTTNGLNSPSPRPKAPFMTETNNNKFVCWDANCDNGICATAAWEEAFRRALSQDMQKTSVVATIQLQQEQQHPTRASTDQLQSPVVEPPLARNLDAPTVPPAPSQAVGALCSVCGKRTVALYPSSVGGGLSCKACRRRSKSQGQRIHVTS